MIGFVILSHNNPAQLRRLIRTLNAVYGDPPIACHHDFSQSTATINDLGTNVRFVDAFVRTGWGRWSLVVGFLRALRLLYTYADPDWFVLLSAADYPIKTANEVEKVLSVSNVDAFIDLQPVHGTFPNRHQGDRDPNLGHHSNVALATRRYLHARVAVPFARVDASYDSLTQIPDFANTPKRTFRIPLMSPLSPFNDNYLCYVGSQWFTGNRKTASILLHPTAADIELRRFYSFRWLSDESFIHTILGNRTDVMIARNPHRYTRWDKTAAHPLLITIDDLPDLHRSTAHFARKFSQDDPVLDRLDIYLGV